MAHSDSQIRLRELESRLTQVSNERDELQSDVERLCLQGGSSMFSRSYVISERLIASEKELRSVRQKLNQVTEDRDELKSKSTKLSYELAVKENDLILQKKNFIEAETEKLHYQSQIAKVVTERDRAVYDAEDLKAQSFKFERAWKDAEGKLECETAARIESESKLASCMEQLKKCQHELDLKSRECLENHELRKRIKQKSDIILQLEQKEASLKGLGSLQDSLEQAQSELEKCTRELTATKQKAIQLSSALAAAESKASSLESRLAECLQRAEVAERQAGTLKSATEEAASRCSAAESHVEELKTQLAALTSDLDDAHKESSCEIQQREQEAKNLRSRLAEAESRANRMSAGNRKAGASTTVGFKINDGRGDEGDDADDLIRGEDRERVAILQDMVTQLKIKLAQATQEKVEALLQVAAAGSEAREASHSRHLSIPLSHGSRLSGRQSGQTSTVHKWSAKSTGTSPQASPFLWIPTPSMQHVSSTSAAARSGASSSFASHGEAELLTRATSDGFTVASVAPVVSPVQAALRRAQERLMDIDRLAQTAGMYKTSLAAAAEVLWGMNDAENKAEVTSDLAALEDDLEQWRSHVAAPPTGKPPNPAATLAEARVAMEVMDLVDLCLRSLKQANGQLAMANFMRF